MYAMRAMRMRAFGIVVLGSIVPSCLSKRDRNTTAGVESAELSLKELYLSTPAEWEPPMCVREACPRAICRLKAPGT